MAAYKVQDERSNSSIAAAADRDLRALSVMAAAAEVYTRKRRLPSNMTLRAARMSREERAGITDKYEQIIPKAWMRLAPSSGSR